MARAKVADKEVREDFSGVDFTFVNGAGSLAFDLDKVPEGLISRLACHGAAQKIGDSYAGVSGDAHEAYNKASAVVELLYAGEWGAEREAGVGISVVIEAVIRVLTAAGKPVDRDATTEKYTKGADGMTGKECRDAALENAKVAAMVKVINAERASERASKALESANAAEAGADEYANL